MYLHPFDSTRRLMDVKMIRQRKSPLFGQYTMSLLVLEIKLSLTQKSTTCVYLTGMIVSLIPVVCLYSDKQQITPPFTGCVHIVTFTLTG